MHKVYQSIICPEKGDCFRAAVASLLELQLEEVPNFVEYKRWYSMFLDFLSQRGYLEEEYLENELMNPLANEEFSFKQLQNYSGVSGYFIGIVYSPLFNKGANPRGVLHALIIDKNFNIVHDPNSLNVPDETIYPSSHLYNGIKSIYVITKNKET